MAEVMLRLKPVTLAAPVRTLTDCTNQDLVVDMFICWTSGVEKNLGVGLGTETAS